MKLISRALAAGALIAVVAALVSCGSTINATSIEYAGVPHPPPSDPAKVVIMRREPVAPHERLGEVTVDTSVNPAPSVSEIEDKLRQEGAKLGADAIVVVLDRIQPAAVYAWPLVGAKRGDGPRAQAGRRGDQILLIGAAQVIPARRLTFKSVAVRGNLPMSCNPARP